MNEDKIAKWNYLAIQLKKIKKEEMSLRKEICAEIFVGSTAADKREIKIGSYEIKATNKTKVDLDKEALISVIPALNAAALACIKYDPKLIAKELKELPDDNVLWEVITEKPAAPALEIISEDA